MNKKTIILLICVLSYIPVLAHATLLTGKMLEGDNSAGTFLPSPQAVVGAGVEYTSVDWFGNDWFQVDISEDGLVEVAIKNVNLFHGASQLLTFTDVFDDIADFVGFDFLSSGGGVTGFDQSKLSFSKDSFSLQLGQGVGWGNANVGFITAQLHVVPEPASIALLGLGLAGIGFSRKKKTA